MRLASLLILLFITFHSFGQLLRTEGKTIVNDQDEEIILRGMGLGGWMLQEGYMMQTGDIPTANTQFRLKQSLIELIGEENTNDFYDRWLANFVTKRDIDSLKSWGFNSVRLPMHYNLYTLPIEDEPVTGQQTWLETGFELTDMLLDWCKQNEMYLILDLHAAPGGQGYDEAISDYDPTKPSLWESAENRAKTVALWRRIAERYANEEWIGGYDLINEVNWNLNAGQELRVLYGQITTAIREVDQNHIIFIEGNWFANDFTGLTPPWDDNMVYSFHKYWSYNDQGSIQWVLDMREEQNVPLWMGESGENSNTWFTDAIKLFEDNNIGWAWWPMKKIETLNSPFSIEYSQGYRDILDYWRGTKPKPTLEVALASLQELTDNTLVENTAFRKEVPDAMIRQPHTDETIPYTVFDLPGLVYMSDFDLGKNGFAYYDVNDANYSLSTGNFTAWNSGWAYRNDGVDIEVSPAGAGSNGYQVGFVKKGEWINYSVDVQQTAAYDITVQKATLTGNGKFTLSIDGEDIMPAATVTGTGGWTTFNTLVINDVLLEAGEHTLTFHALEEPGFNIRSLDFQVSGSYDALDFKAISGYTRDDETSVKLILNKPIDASTVANAIGGFSATVSGANSNITSIGLEGTKTLVLTLSGSFHANDGIRLSYNGTTLKSASGQGLNAFSNLLVTNTLVFRHFIPSVIEAEEYSDIFGLETETTTDIGGGQNLGFTDVGDYADYLIEVAEAGEYILRTRIAAESKIGRMGFFLVEDGEETLLTSQTTPITGGWQEWRTLDNTIELPAGEHILRMKVQLSGFNLNWIEIAAPLSAGEQIDANTQVYPNPARDVLTVETLHFDSYQVLSFSGQVMQGGKLEATTLIPLRNLESGIYLLRMEDRDKTRAINRRFIINK